MWVLLACFPFHMNVNIPAHSVAVYPCVAGAPGRMLHGVFGFRLAAVTSPRSSQTLSCTT